MQDRGASWSVWVSRCQQSDQLDKTICKPNDTKYTSISWGSKCIFSFPFLSFPSYQRNPQKTTGPGAWGALQAPLYHCEILPRTHYEHSRLAESQGTMTRMLACQIHVAIYAMQVLLVVVSVAIRCLIRFWIYGHSLANYWNPRYEMSYMTNMSSLLNKTEIPILQFEEDIKFLTGTAILSVVRFWSLCFGKFPWLVGCNCG